MRKRVMSLPYKRKDTETEKETASSLCDKYREKLRYIVRKGTENTLELKRNMFTDIKVYLLNNVEKADELKLYLQEKKTVGYYIESLEKTVLDKKRNSDLWLTEDKNHFTFKSTWNMNPTKKQEQGNQENKKLCSQLTYKKTNHQQNSPNGATRKRKLTEFLNVATFNEPAGEGSYPTSPASST